MGGRETAKGDGPATGQEPRPGRERRPADVGPEVRPGDAARLGPAQVLGLQRLAGNRASASLLMPVVQRQEAGTLNPPAPSREPAPAEPVQAAPAPAAPAPAPAASPPAPAVEQASAPDHDEPAQAGPEPPATVEQGPASPVLAGFRHRVEALRGRLGESAEARKREIRRYADAEKLKLTDAVDAEARGVDSAYADAITAVGTSLTDARNAVTGQRDAKIQSAREAADNGLRTLDDTVAAKQRALRDAAGENATAATAFGTEEAQRAVNTARVLAADAVAVGARKAAELAPHKRGDLSSREAREMAGQLAADLAKNGNDLAASARQDAGALAAKFRKEAEDGAAKFVESKVDARRKIEGTRDAAVRDITELARQPLAQLETRANDLQRDLRAQQQDAAAQVRAAAGAGVRGIDAAAQTATRKVDDEAAGARRKLDDTTTQLAGRLDGVGRRAAERVVDRAEADLTAAVDAFDTGMGKFATDTKTAFEAGSAQVGAQVSAQATRLVTPVNDAATRYADTAANSATETTRAIGDRAARAGTDIGDVVTKVGDELQKTVDTSRQGWTGQLGTGKAEITAKVDRGLAEERRQVTGLPAKIDERAKEIEEESWLSRGLKWVGGVVVGLLKALAIAVVVIVAVVLVVLVVAAVVIGIAYAIGGLAAVFAVVGFVLAVAEALAGVAAFLLVLAAAAIVLRALWLMYQSFTKDGLTDFERGELFGEALFDVLTVVFGEEIAKWFGEWFKGLEFAGEGGELAELRKLVPDEELLNRLLKAVNGDAKEVKALLGLVGNDGAKLEELLALTGNDTGKLRELAGLAGGDGARAIGLVRKAEGNAERVLELLRAEHDVAKVEAALDAAADLRRAGVAPARVDAMDAGRLRAAKDLLPAVGNDGRKLDELLTLVHDDPAKAADLVRKANGDADRTLAFLRTAGGDVAKAEAALDAAVELERAGMDRAFVDALTADDLTAVKKLLPLASQDGAALERVLNLCGKDLTRAERFLKALPGQPADLERLIGEAGTAPPVGSGADRIARVLDRIGEGPHSVPQFEAEVRAQVKIDTKVLRGEVNPNGKLIGGHSPEILTSPDYRIVGTPTTNADGTVVAKFRKVLSPGPPEVLSTPKKSTLAPRGWTDADVLDAGDQVARTPVVQTRATDNATLHTGTVNGVGWVVIKDASGRVTSSFPTGGQAFTL
ncbi:EndoU domain-containing protein [Amycolatopsis sp. NPDC004625]|uniref:EndoU domain-containing protein n=1 Tax=Amycolatopsis sp. NPDC004625 TaxID=3154670 RepID=UPI0033BECE47